MQYQKYNNNLRSILLSKYNPTAIEQAPQIKSLQIRVLSEYKSDAIVNALLSWSLVPNQLQVTVQNFKKPQLKTSTILNPIQAMSLVYIQLPLLLQQSVDKVLAVNYATSSSQVVFSFKGLDVMSGVLRPLWKLLDLEVGGANLELTVVTNGFVSWQNESLLRLYQLPVVME